MEGAMLEAASSWSKYPGDEPVSIWAQRIAVELSSFQLHDTPSINPTVGVLTNLAPDHLDRQLLRLRRGKQAEPDQDAVEPVAAARWGR